MVLDSHAMSMLKIVFWLGFHGVSTPLGLLLGVFTTASDVWLGK